MKCIKCGYAMEPEAPRALVAEVRGKQVQVQIAAPQCSNCKRVVLNAKSRRAYRRSAADAYRRDHSLLTTHELDQLRRSLGMTWKQFADYVPVGTATLKRWMGGEIQSESMDMLVRLKADFNFIQKAADDLLVRLTESGSVFSRVMEMPTQPSQYRRRLRVEDVCEAADTDLALCA